MAKCFEYKGVGYDTRKEVEDAIMRDYAQEYEKYVKEGIGESTTEKTQAGEQKNAAINEFEKLASTIPVSDKVKEFGSAETIYKYTGEKLTEEQGYLELQLKESLAHGQKTIEAAKTAFGDNYVEKTLEYLDGSNLSPVAKANLFVNLRMDLQKKSEVLPNDLTITKQKKLVTLKSQDFAKETGQAVALWRLQKFAETGFDMDKVTADFFSSKQLETKSKINKSLQADADVINKEAELIESQQPVESNIDADVSAAIKKGIEKEIENIYQKLPTARKAKADVYIAALDKFQAKLRSKTYGGLALPVAVLDSGITTIKLAIKAGVNIADAIELGINKIKELHGKKWDKEDEFRKDIIEQFKENGVDVEKKGKTNSEKLQSKIDGLEKAKQNIREQIANKQREIKVTGNTFKGNVEVQRLIAEKKALQDLLDKYVPKENKFVDEKQEKKITAKIIKEIEDINSQIQAGEKTLNEKGEDVKTSENIEKLKAEKKARLDVLEAIDPVKKEVVKAALIDAGFGREITVTTKQGKEKRTIIDWKKLAGSEGSIEKIQANVETYLKGKGYSDGEISRMSNALTNEYKSLRASIVEKSLNELTKGNKVSLTPEQKSASKRLSEMYDYGMFEQQPDTYDYLMNKVLGVNDVSQTTFFKIKQIGNALSSLYNSKINNTLIDPYNLTHAVNTIDNKLRILLNDEVKSQSGKVAAAKIVQSFMEAGQRMMLNTVKQRIENPLSGAIQNAITELQSLGTGKKETPELRKQRSKMARTIFKDIILNGSVYFGKQTSMFVNKGGLDDFINKMSDSQVYHGIMSEMLGRGHLEAADAMFKSMLTDKYFAQNLIKVLMDKTNPQGAMTKDAATKYVTEALTGQNFEKAQVTAKQIIDEINKNQPEKLVPDNQHSIDRLANDIVRQTLITGKKITIEQLKASYESAYKAAGYDLGHEANNLISKGLRMLNSTIENELNIAIKNKNWGEATALIYSSILSRNIMNPFVGGGTNWIVLKLQKAGIDIVSGLYNLSKVKDIDLSSDTGVKQLEKTLTNNLKSRNTNGRLLIGGMAMISTYLALRATGSDKKYEDWIKENKWAQKYAWLVLPELTILIAAAHNKELGYYLAQLFNKNEAYDKANNLIKGIVEAEKKGEYAKLGSAVGSSVNIPLPWRMARDLEAIYRGIMGKEQRLKTPTRKGFVDGFFKGGLYEYITSEEGTNKSTAPPGTKIKTTKLKTTGGKIKYTKLKKE